MSDERSETWRSFAVGEIDYPTFLRRMGVSEDLIEPLDRTVVAANGRGIGSEASVAEELRGMAELMTKDGHVEWAKHLLAKADALDAALPNGRFGMTGPSLKPYQNTASAHPTQTPGFQCHCSTCDPELAKQTATSAKCICPVFRDVGGVERTGLADLMCPVHGVGAIRT